MPIALLFPEYVIWHYMTAPKLCLNIASNFLWFTYHFFSIPELSKTLFAPWNGSENILAHVFGFVVRLIVIMFGYALCAIVAMVGVGLCVAWLLLPLVVLGLITEGIRLLIS